MKSVLELPLFLWLNILFSIGIGVIVALYLSKRLGVIPQLIVVFFVLAGLFLTIPLSWLSSTPLFAFATVISIKYGFPSSIAEYVFAFSTSLVAVLLSATATFFLLKTWILFKTAKP
jgi:hypothetical protein